MSTPISRRGVLLLSVAGGACAVEGGTLTRRPARDDTDAGASSDAPLDAAMDDRVDAVTEDHPDAVTADHPDATRDVASEDHLDAAAEDHLDAATEDHLDAATEDHLDAAMDDRVEASADCGLKELYDPSLPLSEVPTVGGVVDYRISVVLARDARGLYAFSAVCPHSGCVVRIEAGASTICPCHDSTFDDDGQWIMGPARRPLLNHPVEVCDGRVYVDRSLGVPVGTRRPL